METFTKLFGSLLAFVYRCFDRIVILGHIPLLTRHDSLAQARFISTLFGVTI
jgi:hypothetical protein